jgi:hypothetical protein
LRFAIECVTIFQIDPQCQVHEQNWRANPPNGFGTLFLIVVRQGFLCRKSDSAQAIVSFRAEAMLRPKLYFGQAKGHKVLCGVLRDLNVAAQLWIQQET